MLSMLRISNFKNTPMNTGKIIATVALLFELFCVAMHLNIDNHRSVHQLPSNDNRNELFKKYLQDVTNVPDF